MPRLSRAFATLLGVVALCACDAQTSAHDPSEDATALVTTAAQWETYYNDKNANAVSALYTEDAQLAPPGAALVNGRAAIREFFAKEFATSLPITVTADASGIGGEWAWRSGAWSVSGDRPVTGKFLEVWRRTEQGWRMHRDIWNLDAPAAPPAPAAAPAAGGPSQ